MSVTSVDVPSNTMLADLDEGLRRLLIDQLARHGFEDVDISFETPTKDWAAGLTRPTVNLFMCDLRRSALPSPTGPSGSPGNRSIERPPALRVDCTFAITAWSKAVIDEHRLLSQVLGILYAHPVLDDLLGPRMQNGSQEFAILARVGEQRTEGRAEMWRSVDGHYKPALDYVVALTVEAGQRVEWGPEVRTMTLRTGLVDGPRGRTAELHMLGGQVRDGDGEPVRDAWVVVVDLGRVVVSDESGRFKLPRMPVGTHDVRVRDASGRETTVAVEVPGGTLDVVL